MILEELCEPRECLVCTAYSSKHRDRIFALERIVGMISHSTGEESPVEKYPNWRQ
jgi:hypothetical protein